MHVHSSYSKCMSCNDGAPRDALIFQRDILGCRVLCLTDHVEDMSAPEFVHVMDCVEREAGRAHIPIYGLEWARYPAHHTNFYSVDREVINWLRAMLFDYDHLRPLYEAIKSRLPQGSVVAIRHMHGVDEGEFGVSGPRVTETFNPHVEWAMEAMQTRGAMMVRGCESYPLFPNAFLDAGCEVGLVGGSDHSRGRGPNAFCLTGFWVEEATAAGVFEALRSRMTFGVAGGKIALHATLEGAPAGQSVTTAPPVRILAHVSCAGGVARACLMRDGEVLEWRDVGADSATVELVDEDPAAGRHWYCVTVEGARAFPKSKPLAHSSPFFVTVP